MISWHILTIVVNQEIDPLHKWIGTYNTRRIYLLRFFKWLYNPDIEPDKRPTPQRIIGDIPQFKRKEKSIYKPTDLWKYWLVIYIRGCKQSS
jgi:integrase/recombinase XerD